MMWTATLENSAIASRQLQLSAVELWEDYSYLLNYFFLLGVASVLAVVAIRAAVNYYEELRLDSLVRELPTPPEDPVLDGHLEFCPNNGYVMRVTTVIDDEQHSFLVKVTPSQVTDMLQGSSKSTRVKEARGSSGVVPPGPRAWDAGNSTVPPAVHLNGIPSAEEHDFDLRVVRALVRMGVETRENIQALGWDFPEITASDPQTPTTERLLSETATSQELEMAQPSSVVVPAQEAFTKKILKITDREGNVRGLGFRWENYLVTAYHVYESVKNEECDVSPVPSTQGFPLSQFSALTYSPKLDFIVLKVDKPEMVWAKIGVSKMSLKTPAPNTPFKVIGKQNNSWNSSTGFLRAAHGDLKIKHNATTTKGYSGSPLLSDGKVVGLHLGAANPTNYCLDLSFLPLLFQEGVESEEKQGRYHKFVDSREYQDHADFKVEWEERRKEERDEDYTYGLVHNKRFIEMRYRKSFGDATIVNASEETTRNFFNNKALPAGVRWADEDDYEAVMPDFVHASKKPQLRGTETTCGMTQKSSGPPPLVTSAPASVSSSSEKAKPSAKPTSPPTSILKPSPKLSSNDQSSKPSVVFKEVEMQKNSPSTSKPASSGQPKSRKSKKKEHSQAFSAIIQNLESLSDSEVRDLKSRIG
ncbi:hypothetical protein 1 [Hubei sobemo-like virus 2]|uniref:hypothetical protein 1 n=1 Tax=Hubei sobemo-like virus 2 TaxID=1923205 RepID=UPI00090C5C36|nr:hypothetical protein 1 [Hubei sobemo-like virus 2]APG75902.1 hypothetical protein 1 [Hubei sobemo-like virus 2]